MNEKIHNILLFLCSGIVLLLAFVFFTRTSPVPVEAPLLTQQMIDEYNAQQQQAAHKHKQEEAARKRAELIARLEACKTDEECIIVDKDPCGCLRGPESVTAINSNFSLEFSRLMEKRFATTTTCPSVGSGERECSSSAHPACVSNRCKIVY